MKQLILGGARSGKSRYAEQQAEKLAASQQQTLIYVATATAEDGEMCARIQQHQQRRGAQWQLVEQPLHLSETLERYNRPDHCVLVDCLTLWLTNALLADQWPTVRSAFLSALENTQANVLCVSNEVGSGVVPMGELSREFVDESGRLHQQLAVLFEQVTLVVAGLPLMLKE